MNTSFVNPKKRIPKNLQIAARIRRKKIKIKKKKMSTTITKIIII
jgi:hypothetical protein